MGSAFSKCCQADDAAQSFLANNPGTFPTSKNSASREQRETTGATRVTEPETPTGQNMILGMLKERNERSLSQVQPTSGERGPNSPRDTSAAPSIVDAANETNSVATDETQNNFISYPTSGKDTPLLKGNNSPFLERTAQSSDGAGIVVVTCIDQSPALSPLRSSSEQQDQTITPITSKATSPNSRASKEPSPAAVAPAVSTLSSSSTEDATAALSSTTDNEPCCHDASCQESEINASKTELKDSEAVISCDAVPTIAVAVASPPAKKRGKDSKAQISPSPVLSDTVPISTISSEVSQLHSPAFEGPTQTKTKKVLTPSKPRAQASSMQVSPTSFLSDGQPVSSTSSPTLVATLAPVRAANDIKDDASSTVISATDFKDSTAHTDASLAQPETVPEATLVVVKIVESQEEVLTIDSADVPTPNAAHTPANNTKKTKSGKRNSSDSQTINNVKADTSEKDVQASGFVSSTPATPVKTTGKSKPAEANGENNSADLIPQSPEKIKTESNGSASAKSEDRTTDDGKVKADAGNDKSGVESPVDDLNSSPAKPDETNAKKKKPKSGRKSKRGGAN